MDYASLSNQELAHIAKQHPSTSEQHKTAVDELLRRNREVEGLYKSAIASHDSLYYIRADRDGEPMPPPLITEALSRIVELLEKAVKGEGDSQSLTRLALSLAHEQLAIYEGKRG